MQEFTSEKNCVHFCKRAVEEYGQPVHQTHPHLLKEDEVNLFYSWNSCDADSCCFFLNQNRFNP